MDVLVNFIMNGAAEFTPDVLVRYMVFVMVLSCIASIIDSMLGIGRS